MKGEGASVSLLGEPQNLSALRDKMGRRMLSKEVASTLSTPNGPG